MSKQAIDESPELSVHENSYRSQCEVLRRHVPTLHLRGCIAPTADVNSVRPFLVSQFGFTQGVCL